MTCSLRHPTGLRHPVISSGLLCTRTLTKKEWSSKCDLKFRDTTICSHLTGLPVMERHTSYLCAPTWYFECFHVQSVVGGWYTHWNSRHTRLSVTQLLILTHVKYPDHARSTHRQSACSLVRTQCIWWRTYENIYMITYTYESQFSSWSQSHHTFTRW